MKVELQIIREVIPQPIIRVVELKTKKRITDAVANKKAQLIWLNEYINRDFNHGEFESITEVKAKAKVKIESKIIER